MTSTKYHSAEEKEKALAKFQKFFTDGCPRSQFTAFLYEYASNMYGHIAHYSRIGYYDVWFTAPREIVEWLRITEIHPHNGDPACTRSDVEQALAEWIRQSGILARYTQEAEHAKREQDLSALRRLEELLSVGGYAARKYGVRHLAAEHDVEIILPGGAVPPKPAAAVTTAEGNRTFEFHTEAEARAFAEGVQFVNDSSIEVVDVRRLANDPDDRGDEDSWLVILQDDDENR